MKYPTNISRRHFIHGMMALPLAGTLSGCGRRGAELPERYYLEHREEINNEVRPILSRIHTHLEERYGKENAGQILSDTQQRFDELLPELPYIGGDANSLTDNLFQGALGMVFYQTMKSNHIDIDETGEILYFAVDDWLRSMPMVGVSARSVDIDRICTSLQRDAERSQRREYPEDWVFEFIPGDELFDYGVDYLECGICKLFEACDASEFAPYLCLLDYPMSRAANQGLTRTSTLALGGERCDFRYRIGAEMHMEWTPKFLSSQIKE